VFDLGSSLRAAREARGLELAEIEKQIKIRSRYLAALEAERFDEMPLGYGRSFLRTYAQFLELDPRHYLDEYASRFPPEEPPLPLAPLPRRHRVRVRLLLAVVVLALVAAVLAVAAAYFGSANEETAPPAKRHVTHPRKPSLRPPVVQPAAPNKKPVATHRAPAGPARVVVRAAGGDCWVFVRVGSEAGRVVAERTLADGESVSALAKPLLWIRLGAPGAAVLTVAGRRVAVPSSGAPVNLLVGRQGAKVAP
jgi:cytoskeleton protein RodZ